MRWVLVFILSFYPVTAFSQTPSAEGRARTKIWKKDPFLPPSAGAETAEPAVDRLPELQVSAILFSNEHSSAVISGKAYHIGEEVSGYRVLDIQKSYVILGRKDKTFRLELRK